MKTVIYQIFTRLFGNQNTTRKEWGTLAKNGSGKLNDIDSKVLKRIKDMGVTHVWYTGVIRHASVTNYSRYGIPRQHPDVVKGIAGSPYAICDYYDIDPDLATNVKKRMGEWEALIERTHKAGLKVVMDFVPNHVAREYYSIAKPEDVKDLGEDDNQGWHFSAQNNFYYCWGQPLDLTEFRPEQTYRENPAKATGNDRFSNRPTCNDWYETVKLNYGIDYCDAGGRSEHFDPIPDTWNKMTDILLFWAKKGVDAFRCDMAEMVPSAFWAWATDKVKFRYPEIQFIGEVYNPQQYRNYLGAGFDLLYDKVGMYDCLRDVICGHRPASAITYEWQATDDIRQHMLYFLENHDEQRVASDFFAGDARKGIPGMMVSAWLHQNPLMIYCGQEYGERGMDKEGFSGVDGRTTIFDYWCVDTIRRGFYHRRKLTADEKSLEQQYRQIVNLAQREKAIREGQFYDLMYAQSVCFDRQHVYAFLRKAGKDSLLILVNFGEEPSRVSVNIPKHAVDFLELPTGDLLARELLTGEDRFLELTPDVDFPLTVPALGLNDHNKEEYPPAHTAEHLLNQLMMRMFGCERSSNAHIERKKSKISYILDHKPDRREEREIERQMNELIEQDMPVTFQFVTRAELEGIVMEAEEDSPESRIALDRLPEDASDTIRLVRIGDYDVCPCIGKHVRSTAQIGRFEMLGTNWDNDRMAFRVRYKII